MSGSTQRKVFIVALAGPSGTGKSTIAKRIASRLNGRVVSMEVYSADMNHLPLEERAKQNYDIPSSIDVALLENHIRQYSEGKSIEAPIYDFANHLRVDKRETIPAKSLLIVEGILALHFPQLRPYFDLSIYLDASAEVCFHRRKVRDITERQRTLEFIRWQWDNAVLPSMRQYAIPSKKNATLVLDSEGELAAVEKSVFDAIAERNPDPKN